MLPRVLEPEVMDTIEEAVDYDSMDHSTVNRKFVDELLAAAERLGFNETQALRVLDVGTGTALIPIEFCRRPLNTTIIAIDLAVEMLKLAEINVNNAGLADRIQLVRADSKSLDDGDGSYDWVISNSIVHHIPEPRMAMSEMLRVIRPGGLLFVRDLARPASNDAVEHLVQTYAGDENENQQQLFRQSLHAALTVEEVRDLMAEFGWSEECVAMTSDRHWTISGVSGRRAT